MWIIFPWGGCHDLFGKEHMWFECLITIKLSLWDINWRKENLIIFFLGPTQTSLADNLKQPVIGRTEHNFIENKLRPHAGGVRVHNTNRQTNSM